MQRFISTSIGIFLALATGPVQAQGTWDHYGGNEGGLRYSTATSIRADNVDNLIPAWRFSTGDVARRGDKVMNRSNLQVTPILFVDALLMCSPFNEVIALDPGSGAQKWRFDPKIATDVHYGNGFTCRGVTVWTTPAALDATGVCTHRVFVATNDARVIALDAKTGTPCEAFGEHGEIKIVPEIPLMWPGEFQITSAPVVLGDVLIVGSSIGDNARVQAPHGTVRAFDATTGAVRWSWDAIPRSVDDPATKSWGDLATNPGHANVWAPMSIDTARGLVFLPTSSPSPDFFGGLRPGNNAHANSVVALKAATGKLVWSYQIVHHDVWDYDVASQPTLATLDLPAGKRDVVIQGTKQGFVFVLDRETGVPVFSVEERAVPQGAVAGEWLSPTQPIPIHLPALAPQRITADEAFGITPWDRSACRDAIAHARNEGIYTPSSEQGTILFPFTGGGINWGGVAFDPVNQLLYANTSRLIHIVQLFPSTQFDEFERRYPDREVSRQEGAPFGMMRYVLVSPLGIPCNPPPWGKISALDLKSGKIVWESSVGTGEEIAPLGLPIRSGLPVLSGPLVTAGGLVFVGAADRYLRAFDAASGRELWQGRLPTIAAATPMTYEWRGRQYVVIAAGGHRDLVDHMGDTLVAFALPRDGESGPTIWSRTFDRPGGRFWFYGTLSLFGAVALFVAWRRGRRLMRASP